LIPNNNNAFTKRGYVEKDKSKKLSEFMDSCFHLSVLINGAEQKFKHKSPYFYFRNEDVLFISYDMKMIDRHIVSERIVDSSVCIELKLNILPHHTTNNVAVETEKKFYFTKKQIIRSANCNLGH